MLGDATVRAALVRLEDLRREAAIGRNGLGACKRLADHIFFAQIEKLYPDAIREYRRYLEASEETDYAALRLAKLLARAGDAEGAAVALRRFLDANSEDASAWLFFGGLCWRLGRFEQAGDAFESCLRIDPNNTKAKLGLDGVGYLRRKVDRLEFDWSGRKIVFSLPGGDFAADVMHLGGYFANLGQLEALQERAPVGGSAVVVGAGDGNDAVFLLRLLECARLEVFETDAAARALAERNLAGNLREVAAGTEVRMRDWWPVTPETGLDSRCGAPVDLLNIDAPALVVDVLRQADSLIARSRPWIHVIFNRANAATLAAWATERNYTVAWRSDASHGGSLLLQPREAEPKSFAGRHYAALQSADAHLDSGQIDEAIGVLADLVGAWPRWPVALLTYAIALLQRRESGRGDSQDLVKAYSALLNAVGEKPDLADGWRLLGRLAFESGLVDQGRQFFQRTLELAPGDAEAIEALRNQ